MRLFLIPLTPKRAFIYAQKQKILNAQPSYLDRITTKASDTWLKWEKHEKGWQKSLTQHGNKLLRRIAYEEWALKSIPSVKRRASDDATPAKKIDVVYPPSILKEAEISKILLTLGTERAALHKKRLIWSVIGMPITYSHWRALKGGEHLEYLVKERLFQPVASFEFDKIYTTKLEKMTNSSDKSAHSAVAGGQEVMLVTDSQAKEVAEVLETPSLVVEIERACEQISGILEKKQKEQLEKNEQEEKNMAPEKMVPTVVVEPTPASEKKAP